MEWSFMKKEKAISSLAQLPVVRTISRGHDVTGVVTGLKVGLQWVFRLKRREALLSPPTWISHLWADYLGAKEL